MPSSKPAIAVRLPQHVFDVFARLAELQGRSKGSVVAEILEAVYPPLMRTVALLEAAAEAPKQVRESLVGVLEDIERDLVKRPGEASRKWTGSWRNCAGFGGKGCAGQAHPRRGPRWLSGGVEGGSNPRACNTGVRSGCAYTFGRAETAFWEVLKWPPGTGTNAPFGAWGSRVTTWS